MNIKDCFISPEIEAFDTKKKQPASYVRKRFFIKKPVQSATLQMTALGVYQAYINGQKPDDQLLTPGYTDYNYRVQFQNYDVTNNLYKGENVIAAIIGDGWYRGCINIGSVRNTYGTRTAWAFVLQIEYRDGSHEEICSDDRCRATQNGPLRENDLKTIECYDARLEMPGWNTLEFDDASWHGVTKAAYAGNVIQQQGERVLLHEHFTPAILHTPDGSTVLDFGQNFAGLVTFTVTGRSDQKVSLTMGETLDEHRNFTMKNLSAEGASLISGEVGQRIEYTLKDGLQHYTPIFLYCGFRYVKLENWPEVVKAENFNAFAIYSDLPYTGSFRCSHAGINQLVQNVRWSMKSNFVDIPEDCPTRERTGWTADISVFSETSCYLGDVRRFLRKWLADYKLEQGADGNLPFVVPNGGKDGMQKGCLGWSNAIANIAMTLYAFYGDKKILADVYETVERFVAFNVKRAKKRNPFLLFRHFKDRNLIVETGFHYGEWLEPGSKMYKDYIRDLFYPDTEVTTAWFYKTVEQLADMASVLGKTDDEKKYRALQTKLKAVYQENFLTNGLIKSNRLCRFVRPLSMGLIEKDKIPAAAAELNRKCIERNYTIGTGFLTTWKLLDVLTENGYIQTAYHILENEHAPGWLYEIAKGATTMWENWFGIDENNVPSDSQNHYAPGSVVAWLFRTCAGIRPLKPGFEEIQIQPVPGGSLSWAEAEMQTVRGRISAAWRIEGGTFMLTVHTPEGVPTKVILPDGSVHRFHGGNQTYTQKP